MFENVFFEKLMSVLELSSFSALSRFCLVVTYIECPTV